MNICAQRMQTVIANNIIVLYLCPYCISRVQLNSYLPMSPVSCRSNVLRLDITFLVLCNNQVVTKYSQQPNFKINMVTSCNYNNQGLARQCIQCGSESGFTLEIYEH